MDLSRRNVLKLAGGAAAGLGMPRRVLTMFEDGSVVVQDHKIDADKRLSRRWRDSLTARGRKEIWAGDELDSIGMPVGGIAAGQLYLKGDGTLGWWEVFNHHAFLGYGLTSYAKREIPRRVECGFAVTVNGARRILCREDFPDVTFKGEYPAATNTYPWPGTDLTVVQTAYSPFIPLNARDSALPATIFEITIRNNGTSTTTVDLEAFLENAVARSAENSPGTRQRSTKKLDGRAAGFIHAADPAEDPFTDPPKKIRPAILLADFEGESYGEWTATGEAFGTQPARGTLPNQQRVAGFEGRGLVNTFLGGDKAKGRLISPEFKIERRLINFKIGGGNHPEKTCINLLVEGRVVRTATGLDDERLLWAAWDVAEFEGQTARIEIVDDMTGGWGHINIDHIEQSDQIRSLEDLKARRIDLNRDHGTLGLVLLQGSGEVAGEGRYQFGRKHLGRIKTGSLRLAPGESRTFPFALVWHFPNHPNGREYANWFKDAGEVADYVLRSYDRLSAETKTWVETYYKTTLPYWLLDRLASTNSYLATGTAEWWGNGRFWAWEGVVCCAGTCTHVWNYEHGMARLFPELERNVRNRQDFGEGFDEATGLVGFRGNRAYAADGQCGTVLKAYREHLTSADDSFLKEHWVRIKKALLYSIGRDGNADGLIEDQQHNTFDIDFYGANTFVGSLYLAALRAGEEMASEMGDRDFARLCRQICEKGQQNTVDRLWNGEYFIQTVNENAHKEHQYGPGCLSDQVFGQGWAHQVGLGYIYPADKVKKSLESIWTYNFSMDVGHYNDRWKPERPFAVGNEAGLFICTWPKGGRQNEPVRYRDEVWTGIEYQVAGHMVWEGMIEEGLSVCRAIHERYHPAKRNPYNEVECSDHYARALASWGVFTALSGFTYHGPKGIMGFAPKVNDKDFQTVFTAAEGWGLYSQDQQSATLKMEYGELRLTELHLTGAWQKASALLNGQSISLSTHKNSETLVARFKSPVTIKKGSVLKLSLS